jgi:hypothetical protein
MKFEALKVADLARQTGLTLRRERKEDGARIESTPACGIEYRLERHCPPVRDSAMRGYVPLMDWIVP